MSSSPDHPAFAARAERLLDRISERGLDSVLVSDALNVRYLTGFTGSNGACVISREERLFFTDFRYLEQAREQVHGFERKTGQRDLIGDMARRLRGRAGFDDGHVTVRAHARLKESVGEGVELVPAGGLVERLREIKDEFELQRIAEAATMTDGIYEYLADRGLAGRTEREVARDLEREIRDRGAEDAAFPVIVAAGAHGALPHAEPRDAEIPSDTLVVVDVGCRVDGYCSDCTRTVATGDLGDEAREAYELVRSAQQTGLAAVRASAACRDVDAAARAVIEAGGQGEHFGHGLGHGVGLEVHEAPRLARTADGQLNAGAVVTVEPGVYRPGEFGIRIEDLVAVTPEGCQVLTGFPKSLTAVS